MRVYISNRHVIQQALQLRKPSSQISTCERAVWPAEEVGYIYT